MQDSIRFTPTPTVSYTTTTHWDIRSRSEKEIWAILEDKRDFRHAKGRKDPNARELKRGCADEQPCKEVLRSQGLDQSGVNSPTLFKGVESKKCAASPINSGDRIYRPGLQSSSFRHTPVQMQETAEDSGWLKHQSGGVPELMQNQ